MSLPTPAMRPTFQLEPPHRPAVVAAALDALLQRYPGRRAGLHFMLTVPEHQKHFWSPYLTIELSPGGTGVPPVIGEATNQVDEPTHRRDACATTHLHARFSPSPSLFTAIGFTYLALIVIACFALMWAGAQLTLGHTPHAAWIALLCAAGVALLWWISLIGQRLAYEQMFELRRAVEEALDACSPQGETQETQENQETQESRRHIAL